MKKINKRNVLPVVIAILVYLLAYQIPKLLVDIDNVHVLKIALDDQIPLIKGFMFIYICAFFQWAYCMYCVLFESEEKVHKFASAIIIGSLIGFIAFMVYPTGIERPEIVGDGFVNWFCRIVYNVDSIVNACPSFHCFCSTIVILIYKECENISKSTIYINIIYSILVFASTLFTKQHVIMDILPGILLAYVSMFLSNKIQFKYLFNKLNNKLNIK